MYNNQDIETFTVDAQIPATTITAEQMEVLTRYERGEIVLTPKKKNPLEGINTWIGTTWGNLSRDNQIKLTAGFIILVASIPYAKNYNENFQKSAVKDREVFSKQEIFERNREQELYYAEQAEARFKAGCVSVVAQKFQNGKHYFTNLIEGKVVKHPITGAKLAKGTIVCDASGMTATIKEDGTPGYFAYTGNRQVVQSALRAFNSEIKGASYSQPISE